MNKCPKGLIWILKSIKYNALYTHHTHTMSCNIITILPCCTLSYHFHAGYSAETATNLIIFICETKKIKASYFWHSVSWIHQTGRLSAQSEIMHKCSLLDFILSLTLSVGAAVYYCPYPLSHPNDCTQYTTNLTEPLKYICSITFNGVTLSTERSEAISHWQSLMRHDKVWKMYLYHSIWKTNSSNVLLSLKISMLSVTINSVFIHQQFSHGADRGNKHIGNTDM